MFVLLAITFFVLGIGNAGAHTGIVKLGGWIGLATALVAWYASFAEVTNATFGRTVLPVTAADAIDHPVRNRREETKWRRKSRPSSGGSRRCSTRRSSSLPRSSSRAREITDPGIFEKAEDYEGFWAEQADALDWAEKWDTVLDDFGVVAAVLQRLVHHLGTVGAGVEEALAGEGGAEQLVERRSPGRTGCRSPSSARRSSSGG